MTGWNSDVPRPLYYAFAHRVLRDLVLDQWNAIRPRFADGSIAEWLRAMWRRLETIMDAEAGASVEELHTGIISLGSDQGYVVTLPKPASPGEAWLAIIPDRAQPTRYFVVEQGESPIPGERYWLLCEWLRASHVNYGRIDFEASGQDLDSEPLRAAAAARVSELLRQSVRPPD